MIPAESDLGRVWVMPPDSPAPPMAPPGKRECKANISLGDVPAARNWPLMQRVIGFCCTRLEHNLTEVHCCHFRVNSDLFGLIFWGGE